MDFDNSFSLEEMQKDAQKQMIKTRELLVSIDNTASEHLDGRSRMSLLGAVFVSLIWFAVFLIAYYFFGCYIPKVNRFPLGRLLLGVSLVLATFVEIDNLVKMKHYGTILRARRRIVRLRNRVTRNKKALSSNLQLFLERRGAQWELPLEAGASISQEAGRIVAQLTSLEALSSGFIVRFKLLLYYLACIVWVVVGEYTILEFTDIMSDSFMGFLLIVALTALTCIIDVVIAKAVWSATNEDVGNLTIFAILFGPVIFVILAVAAAIGVALIKAVIANLTNILSWIICIACLIGTSSGG